MCGGGGGDLLNVQSGSKVALTILMAEPPDPRRGFQNSKKEKLKIWQNFKTFVNFINSFAIFRIY